MTVRLAGARVVVAGRGITGESAARAVAALGAEVTLLDDRDGSAAAGLPAGTTLVVASPGWRLDHPLFADAQAKHVPVIGDAELAWQLALGQEHPAGWLVVTGTNGKTSTTELLASILAADGRRSVACGNIGLPVLDAVLANPGYDLLAVELSSFQLQRAPGIRPLAGAVLNVAPDHLDWHGSLEHYAAAKLRAFGDPSTVAVGVAGAEGSEAALRRAPGRRVLVTLGPPAPGQLGMVSQLGGPALLVDRAFAPGAPAHAEALASLDELPYIRAPHELTNALVAAALARAAGVETASVGPGLAAHRPGAHRRAVVGQRRGVQWVDDSKATNPHAALVSITSYDRVIWVAGGLNKGLAFDDLVRDARPHLAAAVLLGRCAGEIAEAMSRHAPEIPLIRVDSLEDGVREAARLAREGETVLLAPAAASQDMFRDYGHRGDSFAAAVRALPA